jgi:ribose-phosphate pyrophosphokinase
MITLNCKPVEFITFSDGSETCRIPSYEGLPVVRVRIEDCTRDLIRIGLVKYALGNVDAVLDLRYMPQARADRQFEPNMPVPLDLFADILNSYDFHTVVLQDPHSLETMKKVKNVKLIETTIDLPGFLICVPDKGSLIKFPDADIVLEKVRNVKTGDITGMRIVKGKSLIKGADIVLVDDICDGGRTFIEAAKLIHPNRPNRLFLHITHGIYSKGIKELKSLFDHIITKNLIGEQYA